jgi:hypothetical protein
MNYLQATSAAMVTVHSSVLMAESTLQDNVMWGVGTIAN